MVGRLENTPTCADAKSREEDAHPRIDEAAPFYASDSQEAFYLGADHLGLTKVTGNLSSHYLTCMLTAEENAVTTG